MRVCCSHGSSFHDNQTTPLGGRSSGKRSCLLLGFIPADTMTSYPEAPRRTGVPREVIRWLQSLDLRFCPKNFRRYRAMGAASTGWRLPGKSCNPITLSQHDGTRPHTLDISNGFITAEVFSWYFPEDISLHSYGNGTSLATKLGNWSQLEKFFLKRNLNISKELIDGTIHCKPGAAELFLQDIYVMLTNKRVRNVQDIEVDFTDRYYQEGLPMVARSTASKAVKCNIKLSEILSEPDLNINKQKVEALMELHVQHRQQERTVNPMRFNVKSTIGDRAIRHPPRSVQSEEESLSKRSSSSNSSTSDIRNKTTVQFKEIKVKQADRNYMLSSVCSSSSSSM